jgi:hypothetical protein
MAVCGGGNAAYAAQYGQALTSLVACGGQQQQGPGSALAPAAYRPPVVAPAQQGAFAAAAQRPGTPQPGSTALAPAPRTPAFPAANASQPNQSFHDSYAQLDGDTKDSLVAHMESNGINIPQKFSQLQDAGYITAPSADYSKQDMAGFVMEAGLRMAQAGARGDYYYNPFAAAATGVLGATEAYRAREMQARQMSMQYNQMQWQRELELAKMQQEANIAAAQRKTQLEVAQTAATGQQYRGVEAARVDAAVRRGQAAAKEKGNAYYDSNQKGWFYPDGTPVMEKRPGSTQWSWRTDPPQAKPTAPKPAPTLSPKDVEGELTALRKNLDENGATTQIPGADGKPKPWISANEAEKDAYLNSQAQAIRAREAPQSGQTSAAPNPYQKWAKPANAAPAAGGSSQSGQNTDAEERSTSAPDASAAEDAAREAAREYENEQGGED